MPTGKLTPGPCHYLNIPEKKTLVLMGQDWDRMVHRKNVPFKKY